MGFLLTGFHSTNSDTVLKHQDCYYWINYCHILKVCCLQTVSNNYII